MLRLSIGPVTGSSQSPRSFTNGTFLASIGYWSIKSSLKLMKAWQLTEPKEFRFHRSGASPKPARGEALMRTLRMGICGTDISCYLGKFPFFDYPRIPGRLGVEVLEIGEGVENVKPGDLCSVEPYLNCGECYACGKGQGNCCQNLKVFGVMTDGGLCEQSLIRADKLHPSQKLSAEQLALVETLAIGCHASDRGNPQQEEHLWS